MGTLIAPTWWVNYEHLSIFVTVYLYVCIFVCIFIFVLFYVCGGRDQNINCIHLMSRLHLCICRCPFAPTYSVQPTWAENFGKIQCKYITNTDKHKNTMQIHNKYRQAWKYNANTFAPTYTPTNIKHVENFWTLFVIKRPLGKCFYIALSLWLGCPYLYFELIFNSRLI